MTAKAANGIPPRSAWKFKQFTLTSGSVAYQGGKAFLNTATGKVVPATSAGNGMVFLGIFEEYVTAVAGDKLVNIDLGEEITLRYFVNGGGIVATDIGKLCYSDDDQTVTLAAGARLLTGRILDVSATKGVGVDISVAKMLPVRPAAGPAVVFAANDIALTDVVHSAVYDVPTTAAASTVTLPTAAADGVVAYFAADGVKNGHTIQYRDQAGSVVLTTALVASKRHLVIAAKVAGKWTANAYVSP